MSFKLIAVRVLNGCASHIRKCLHVEELYYLCHDYVISNNKKRITRASKNISPLQESFFSCSDKTDGPCFNLQAIAGMNGDGKSSLVELIIRLINNLICKHGMNPENQLLYVCGVKAELYFYYEDCFYCVEEKDDNEILVYKYTKQSDDSFVKSNDELSDEDVKAIFFYTLVSNYSHYAYNTEEFAKEWKDKKLSPDESDCWMQRIFHKNDGYQSPIGLHPYRERGVIDINRERGLSKSRLASLFLSSSLSHNPKEDYWGLSGKVFYGLQLKDVGYSKLQECTIKSFFNQHRYSNLLYNQIDFVKVFLQKDDTVTKIELDEMASIVKTLHKMTERYLRKSNSVKKTRNQIFYENMYEYAEQNHLLPEESDFHQLLVLLKKVTEMDPLGTPFASVNEDIRKWGHWSAFSLAQIQRIELIDDICDQWRKPGVLPIGNQSLNIDLKPERITVSYADLSDDEKCYHYIIYKTIDVFETYREYGFPCMKYSESALYFGKEEAGFRIINMPNCAISAPFSQLSLDWAGGSHVTLKLRQTYSYCTQTADNTKSLYSLEGCKDDIIPKSELAERANNSNLSLDQMPPAIFNWDLMFKNPLYTEPIPYDSFSSGEKQKMNGMAALVYHVRNVDSLAEVSKHYYAINLILEEIELYFHPEWQRRFCYDLMGLLKSVGLKQVKCINILFVTHSPYILSDIPKTNVLFLKDGIPNDNMQENTFGSNINSLLKNGFFMPGLPIGEFARTKINNLFARLHSGEFDENDLPSIKAEILTVGEPAIRHQLLMLYNGYKAIGENPQLFEAIRTIMKLQRND